VQSVCHDVHEVCYGLSGTPLDCAHAATRWPHTSRSRCRFTFKSSSFNFIRKFLAHSWFPPTLAGAIDLNTFLDYCRCITAVCSRIPHSSSRIIAASLGIYMLTMYSAACLTPSKLEPISQTRVSRIPPALHRRNNKRAASPTAAAAVSVAAEKRRCRDPASECERFCELCCSPKPPRYSITPCLHEIALTPWLQLSSLRHMQLLHRPHGPPL
jgi:hypothetical protein